MWNGITMSKEAHRWASPVLLLVLLVAAAYANSLRGVFVFDDIGSIVRKSSSCVALAVEPGDVRSGGYHSGGSAIDLPVTGG